jgi:hypothetical protein
MSGSKNSRSYEIRKYMKLHSSIYSQCKRYFKSEAQSHEE